MTAAQAAAEAAALTPAEATSKVAAAISRTQLDNLRKELEGKTSEAAQLRRQLLELQEVRRVGARGEGEMQQLQAELELLREASPTRGQAQEVGELQERLAAREADVKALQRRLAGHEGDVRELQEGRDKSTDEVRRLEAEMRALNDENAALQDRLAVGMASMGDSRVEEANEAREAALQAARRAREEAAAAHALADSKAREVAEVQARLTEALVTRGSGSTAHAELALARAEAREAKEARAALEGELIAQLELGERGRSSAGGGDAVSRSQLSRRVRDFESRQAATELEGEIVQAVLTRELAAVERSLSRAHAVPRAEGAHEISDSVEGALRRIRHVEAELEDANRRAVDAHSRAQASEWRARNVETALEGLRSRVSTMDAQRGQLAHSLDASLRQLGSAHHALRDKEQALSRMRSETRASPVDEHPGLMQDLALLQLKLYGDAVPLLTANPAAATTTGAATAKAGRRP